MLFRDAVRALRATPLVTAVAVLSLALGIGANTAIFSILDSLVFKALPVREPQQLAILMPSDDRVFSSWTNPIWEQIRNREHLWAGAAAWSSTRFNLSHGGQTEFVNGLWVSGRFFDVLGVPAILGRTITPGDDARRGGADGAVAVISYGFWQRRFGGAADIVGRTLNVERVSYSIVGVTPPDFFGADVGRRFDIAVPIGTEPLQRGKESGLDHRSMWWLGVMLRLKPDQTFESATAALHGAQPQIREATIPPHYRPQDVARYLKEPIQLRPAATGQSSLRARYERPLTTIMVVVGLVLLIACANIANLLLARATARRHELSVRIALGASRWHLARQLLAESLLLSGIGAALGLVFAHWGSRLLVAQLSTQVNAVFLPLALDWRVLGFTAALAIGTAVLFGTAPALSATRVQPGDALKDQGRSVAGERRWALGNLLVIAQVALSLVLVVAAGLFVRTFVRLATLDLGFETGQVLVVNANARSLHMEPSERGVLYQRLRQALLTVPGVASAAASAITPVSGSIWTSTIEVRGAPRMTEEERGVYVNQVSPGYFETYGTRIVAGRDVTESDRKGAPKVALVNETLARKFFGSASPVGRTFKDDDERDSTEQTEIIGVVEDAVYNSLREPVPPTVYTALAQEERPSSFMAYSVRARAGSPVLLTRSVAAAMSRVNKDVALTFRPLADQVNGALIQERIVAILSGFFGGLALLLAGLGLYGVTAYAVSRRYSEIGIRLALGAAPSRVVWLVLRRVAALVAAGVVLGAAVSWWAARFVAALLYGLDPRDVATFGLGALVLVAVGALAGFVPARRAAKIDPARVLREA